ncbi:MAG TPA: two-component regulator propeller domain-containing protein, partial [Pyrinomonadaceae bacterium]|nr:two-component regulator propeller domain-containing protein [Pyrinomonadaceae bacterium]
ETKPLATGLPAAQMAGIEGKFGRTGYVRFGDTFWFFQFREKASQFLARLRDGKLDISNVDSPDPVGMIADRNGNILIGQLDHGLLRIDASFAQADDVSNLAAGATLLSGPEIAKTIVALAKDREGNVWVASYDGLHLIRDNPLVNVISQRDGLPSNNIYAVAEDPDGSIWFGVWATPGVIARYANGRINTFDLPLVTAITHDKSGQLLIGANNNVWKKSGESFEILDTEVFGTKGAPRNAADEISFVAEDRSGALWIGGSGGLLKYRDGEVRRYTRADGLPSETLVAFLETKAGEIWLGTTSGLARLDGERFTSYRSEFVRSLYEDPDGVLWIGTYDSGIIRYKNGEFRTIAARDGLFSDGVFCILEDDDGWLWMNSNQGIYRVRRDDLNDFADGRISTITSAGYGTEDGLLNVEGNGGKQPAGLRSSDGRLWFPTAGGLAVIDPKRVHRDENAPAVLIEEIKVDQKEIAGFPGQIVLEPGQTALEINYTGIKFTNPERLRFRYKLEGLDDNWTEAGTRRTAYFSHLPYGEYTFRVLAANRDGVWNEQGAGVKLLIDRPFHRTYWFYALVSLLVVGFVGLIYLARVKQLQSIADARELYTRQLLESQERERSRLAMELHDSLGQSLVVIRNRALLGISKKQDDAAMLEQLQEISDASASALQETREIAHTLHPYQIEALGLRTALLSLIDKFESSSDIAFTVEIDDRVSNIPHDVAIAVYRIAQEWFTNVVKHSSASEVSFTLKSDGDSLMLDIVDNGVGFDPETVKKGLGLRGIEERSRMIGAALNTTSSRGAGAALKLSVDLS